MRQRGCILFALFIIVLGCTTNPGRISGIVTYYNEDQPDYMSNIYIVDYTKIDTTEFNYILFYNRVIDLVKTYDFCNGVLVIDSAEEIKEQCINKLNQFGLKNRQEFEFIDSLANVQMKKIVINKFVTMLMADKNGSFQSDIAPGKYLLLIESQHMKDSRYLTEEKHLIFSSIVDVDSGVQKILNHNF